MTAFSKVSGNVKGREVEITVRSLNSKNLDIRTFLPPSCFHLEHPLRKEIKKIAERGRVEIHLKIEESPEDIEIDRKKLKELINKFDFSFKKISYKNAPPELFAFLKDFYIVKRNFAEDKASGEEILRLAKKALKGLDNMKKKEGERMKRAIEKILKKLEILQKRINKEEKRQKKEIEKSIKTLMESFKKGVPEIEKKVEVEIAAMLTRRDVNEEKVRLKSHIEWLKKNLTASGSMGKKLDFIAQEILRESGTLCAKAFSDSLTQVGLEIRLLAEKMREIFSNIE